MLFFGLVYVVEGIGQTGGLIAQPLNNYLKQTFGWTPVEVTAEKSGGWLEIRPPEGSLSYINTRFLRHMYTNQPNHVVTLVLERNDARGVLTLLGVQAVPVT